MKDLNDIIENLLQYPSEQEWFDFKENWFHKDEIGEYISAISNSALLMNKDYGYLVWGIDDNKRIVGTKINLKKDINNEPYEHYLARNLKPSIAFDIIEGNYQNKRIVVLKIPSASKIPVSYNNVRYLRIGSSKVKVDKYPDREVALFDALKNSKKSIVNTEAPDYMQNLTFEKLFMYYAAKGLTLKPETFKENLKLLTKDGKYNIMAMVLADENSIPIRVSVFNGKTKADPLYSVKEYGNTCILYSMDKILEYGDAINIIQADERNRISERKDVPFFDYEAYHEAILNAFVHNKWLTLDAPMISIFTDRIEILSHGTLTSEQSIDGFYKGISHPVNEELASIFLQLRISERSGRGVPKIVDIYGKEAFTFNDNSIVVTIPFNKIRVVNYGVEKDNIDIFNTKLNDTEKKILMLLRDNPNINTEHLMIKTKLSESGVKKNLRQLKAKGYIERIGSKKNGYWNILK